MDRSEIKPKVETFPRGVKKTVSWRAAAALTTGITVPVLSRGIMLSLGVIGAEVVVSGMVKQQFKNPGYLY